MAVPDSPMNIKARNLKENRLRKAKVEKQIISRGCLALRADRARLLPDLF